ncbi:MAG: carbon storage regulator [bacterium]|nr:carbon storage regulator [bacterium]
MRRHHVLVFSRKVSESFAIGGDPPVAVITILGSRKGKIRIGIKADRNVPVNRSEVYEKKFGKKLSLGSSQPP